MGGGPLYLYGNTGLSEPGCKDGWCNRFGLDSTGINNSFDYDCSSVPFPFRSQFSFAQIQENEEYYAYSVLEPEEEFMGQPALCKWWYYARGTQCLYAYCLFRLIMLDDSGGPCSPFASVFYRRKEFHT